MIFYFSGTGNSRWVANALSIALGEPVVSIAEELKTNKKEIVCPLREDEKVLFVYPVHSWGPVFLCSKSVFYIIDNNLQY